ncbi:MAG: hypothetical protein ACR2KC_01870 [Acidimicrobiales bacterium]
MPQRAETARSQGPRPARSFSHHALAVLAGVLVVALGAWLLAGVAFTILRIFELAIVAAGAGWVGYRIGWYRGRRHPR